MFALQVHSACDRQTEDGESRMSDFAERINAAACALLMDPGIKLEHEAICELLIKSGAKPGSEPYVVRIPASMVKDALAGCPSEVAIADRRGGLKMLKAEGGEPSVWTVPGMYWNSRGETRLFDSRDMAAAAHLVDKLPHVDTIFGLALNDVPPNARDVVGLDIMARNTSKHVRVLCSTPAGAEAMLAMRDVVGSYPWFSIGFTAHGPLRWTNLALDIYYRSRGRGIPASVNGEPMAGVSGPVTLAGSTAVGTAEILAGLVVNQLLEPGRPLIFNLGLAHIFDMRTGIAVTGGPENHLYAKAAAELGRFYRIPSASWVSTESMCPDAQAGLEKMCGFLTHMQAGISNIWSVGQLESELTFSPAQAVIDDEMIGYAKRYLRGIEVNEETLALAVIREVGIAGSFLDHEHTFRHYLDELFYPSILFRKKRQDWKNAGSPRLDERAEARAEELMAQPVTSGLSPEQELELGRLTNDFLKKHS
jgi:trimethylamine---corrinoid protein Co-methyltransferase